MPRRKIIRLRIDRFTPGTLPMARLAEYLADYAALLGSRDQVHFSKVEEGSAQLACYAESEQVPAIWHRLKLVESGDGPEDAMRAFTAINLKLRRDEAAATIEAGRRSKLLELPGTHFVVAGYSGISQQGSIEGVLARVGGFDATVPVHLAAEKGRHLKCNTTREVAKHLAPYLFGKPLRLFGTGQWTRTQGGKWELDSFNIDRFEELSDEPLPCVIERIRAIQGNGWATVDDPLEELLRIRNGAVEE